MKGPVLSVCLILTVWLAAAPLSAQSRAVPSGSNAGRGAAVRPSVSSSSSRSSGTAVGYYSYSRASYSSAAGMGNRGYNLSQLSAPVIRGTSFTTVNLYNCWNDYFTYLNLQYRLTPEYFTRFYRNTEPLMTPAMLKLTLRQPLYYSELMLQAIAETEAMLAAAEAGGPVDKKALEAKLKEIRDYAKRIRRDRTLTVYDIRKETKLVGDDDLDALDQSLPKLRELALELHRQLTELNSITSASTISVESYQQPSFESVTKGIEKACKAIANTSKRL